MVTGIENNVSIESMNSPDLRDTEKYPMKQKEKGYSLGDLRQKEWS